MLSICLALLQNPEDKLRFEEFYNKFYNTVYFIAKDFHNIKQDFDEKSFRNYVRVVAKGISIDMYRKEKKHIENVVDADLTEFRNLSADDFEVCDTMLLKQAVDAMPESYKYVFCLKYYYEFSGAEISAKTGISETSVRQKCMLGMKFVRNYIKEAEHND